MSYPWTSQQSDVAAAWPADIFDPIEVRVRDDDGTEIVGETFAVPATALGGVYRIVLDQVPLQQVGVTITVDGDPRTLIPFGEAPAAGEVALSMEMGVLEFHASDAGEAGAASYTGRGTVVMPYLFQSIQAELVAIEEWLDEDLVAAVVAGLSTTGTGDFVRATSPTLVTPALGAATATSLSVGALSIASTGALTLTDYDVTLVGDGKFVASADGTATDPGYTFTGDLNTGMYSSGADAVDFATGGVRRGGFTAAGAFEAGTISIGANVITFDVGGDDAVIEYDGSGNFFDVGAAAVFNGDVTVGGDVDLSGGNTRRINLRGWTGTDGQEGRLVLNGNGAANTHIRDTSGGVTIVFGGSDAAALSGSQSRLRRIWSWDTGGATFPSYSWNSDTNTGMYRPGDDQLGFATGGVRAGGFDASGNFDVRGGLRIAAPGVPGSAGATGTAGDIAWDANYIYICVATDTWKRVAIATW